MSRNNTVNLIDITCRGSMLLLIVAYFLPSPFSWALVGMTIAILGACVLANYRVSNKAQWTKSRTRECLVSLAIILSVTLAFECPLIIHICKDMIDSSYTRHLGNPLGILQMTGSTGDKFVVYDSGKNRFTTQWLDSTYRADSTEEIRYIITADREESVVGSYSFQDAYQVTIKITVRDCSDGTIVARNNLFGNPPPKWITSSGLPLPKGPRTGKAPSDAEIRDTIAGIVTQLRWKNSN